MYEAVAAGQTASDEGGALEHSQAIPKEAHATGVRRIPAAARSIIVLWTASRVAVVLLGWLMSTRLGWHRVLDPWQRQPWTALTGWDSVYYIRIAHEGYAEGPRVAFFSLYPLLIRGTEAVTGLGDAVASLAVSNIAALIGMMGIYVLGRDRLSPQHAWRAVLYLVLSPYAFALVLAYSEGVFIALASWLFVFSDRRRHLPAAALGLLAGMTRVNGLALIAPLAVVAWRRRSPAAAAVAAAPAVGLGLHMMWLWHSVGDPLAFVHAQGHWGGHASFPPLALGEEFWQFAQTGRAIHLLSGLTVVVYLALLVPILRLPQFARHRWEDALYVGGIFALPLLAGVLQSSGRFGLLAFPLFFALADLGLRRPGLHRTYVVFAPVFQILAFGYVALGYLVP